MWEPSVGLVTWVPFSRCFFLNGFQDHFEESQFEEIARSPAGGRKLKPNAVPTLFNVPDPPSPITPQVVLPVKHEAGTKVASNRACGARFLVLLLGFPSPPESGWGRSTSTFLKMVLHGFFVSENTGFSTNVNWVPFCRTYLILTILHFNARTWKVCSQLKPKNSRLFSKRRQQWWHPVVCWRTSSYLQVLIRACFLDINTLLE